jgi:monovalent cation:H+ antiporter-2, CPA2 family
MFRGYFKGVTDISNDFTSQEQLQLHSVEIKEGFIVLGRELSSLPLGDFSLEIQHLRRPNMLEDIEPRPDIKLSIGDIIVLLGLPGDLVLFEKYIMNGK